MTTIYTIGFTKKTLEDFIQRLRKNNVKRLIDIRLNNDSQLSGFAKSKDLEFILRHFGIEYVSVKDLAPNDEILTKYHKDKNWDEYEVAFLKLMETRNAKKILENLELDKKVSCFLCSEDTAEKCHRQLVAELCKDKREIVHL